MREILFRGKRVDNGEWAYGSLIIETNPFDKDMVMTHICDNFYNEILVDPRIIGQYTGLTDKNGVKIFENDIVRYGKKNWVVNWNDETFRWEISLKDECYQYPIYDGQLSVEVIGNKFDNPELIERDNNEKDWIEQIPGGQPKTGRWEHDSGHFANRWICSQCGYKFYFEKSEAKYCPNCGAKMESEE